MKKQTKIVLYSAIGAIVLAILILPKINTSGKHKSAPGEGSGRGSNKAYAIEAMVVKTQDIENNITSVGTALASEEVDIKSEISGRVTDILFKEGTFVKKGQLLVKINDADIQAQLAKSKSRLKLLEANVSRQTQLLDKGMTSQVEYDVAVNELAELKADIQLQNVQLSKTEIRAPFNGKIGVRQISVGAYVSPATLIASLQNVSQIKMDFTVPEKYASQIRLNDIIRFKTSEEKDYHVGKILAIEPKINTQTRTVLVRGIYTNAGNKVIPGSFLEIKLELAKINNTVMIPTFALISDIKGSNVFVYKSGKAVQQDVETGLRTEDNVQIVKGLSPGDTLITSGILQLKKNMKVTISSME